tara:strand:- start:4216 stop:5361 length:1146 start_codon:yes stop_codon:yes gene_type:complete
MTNKLALQEQHELAGAKFIEFANYEMPINYGSQIQEHTAVRENIGVFDVSHMNVIDISGPDSNKFLRYLLANDVAKIKAPGKALYSCLLNHDAGIIDDLVVYHLNANYYRVILNAARKETDLKWIYNELEKNNFNCHILERNELIMLAVQGPNSLDIFKNLDIQKIFKDSEIDNLYEKVASLKLFECIEAENYMIAATGYTGEKGFEILLKHNEAKLFWEALMQMEVTPCGLGARDSLRLEAGLLLYGQDITENDNLLDSNLKWTLALADNDRNFIGKNKLLDIINNNKIESSLIGVILEDKGVIRTNQEIHFDDGLKGIITSGIYSPTLKKSIALARVPFIIKQEPEKYKTCKIAMRNNLANATIVKFPFVRNGKIICFN